MGESRPKRQEIVQSIQGTEGWLKRNGLAEAAPGDAQLEPRLQEPKDGGGGADLEADPPPQMTPKERKAFLAACDVTHGQLLG